MSDTISITRGGKTFHVAQRVYTFPQAAAILGLKPEEFDALVEAKAIGGVNASWKVPTVTGWGIAKFCAKHGRPIPAGILAGAADPHRPEARATDAQVEAIMNKVRAIDGALKH